MPWPAAGSCRFDVDGRSLEHGLGWSDLVEHVVHEVRKPLAANKAYAEILADDVSGPLNPAQREHVETILSSNARLEQQVDSLYELLAVFLGRERIDQAEQLDLSQLCHRVQGLLSKAFEDKGVRISARFQEGLCLPAADEMRLQRTLWRLLDNALRVSEPGSHVQLELEQVDDRAVFTVEDEGPGFAPEAKSQCFDLVRQRERPMGGGVGVSLHLCRAAVEAHGGDIVVTNKSCGGAKVTLELPMVSPEACAHTSQRADGTL